MKRLFALLLALAMLFTLAACGTDAEKEASKPGLDGSPASPQTKKPTDQEVVEAALRLRNQLDQAVNEKNYNAFASLFTETKAEDIRELYEMWNVTDMYDQHYGVVLGEKDGYYYVSCVHAIVGGVVPNHKRESFGETYIIKKIGNTWKFAQGSADVELAKKMIVERLPEEAQTAWAENRNFAVFYSSLGCCFLDTSIYIKDDFTATAVYAWQDADGRVHVAVHITNGTSVNQAANSIGVTLTDSVMGTILKVTADDSFVIPAYSSRIITIEVSPRDVRTGTYLWSETVYANANPNWRQ